MSKECWDVDAANRRKIRERTIERPSYALKIQPSILWQNS